MSFTTYLSGSVSPPRRENAYAHCSRTDLRKESTAPPLAHEAGKSTANVYSGPARDTIVFAHQEILSRQQSSERNRGFGDANSPWRKGKRGIIFSQPNSSPLWLIRQNRNQICFNVQQELKQSTDDVFSHLLLVCS
ncbi:MAG: hypothetical protein WDN46_24005 [Methylocella sp.]